MPLGSPSTTHHATSPADRTGLAVAALVFGVLAAGLAVAVAFLGEVLPYAWYVVLALAVPTLACGALSVGRRHRDRTGSTLALVGTLAGVVALVLGIWGVTNSVRDEQHGPSQQAVAPTLPHTTAPRPVAATTQVPDGTQVPFGSTYVVDNVNVLVSQPERFTPTSVASTTDGSAIQRAMRFTVTLTNNTSRPLNAHGISVVGQVDGSQVGQVVDRNIQDLTDDIAAGATVSYTVAFNLPAATSRMTIQISPESMTSTGKIYYTGTV